MPTIVKMIDHSPERPRRRRLRLIPVLPTLLTLGNLLCGFAAIHFAMRAMFAAGAGQDPATQLTLDSLRMERLMPSFLAIGAMLVFVGMVFDLLDGFAARLINMTSEFGAQIDSLADVVTFGVAPATLVVALMMQAWTPEQVIVTPHSEQLIGRLMWVCAAAYALCTAVRLARFNVEHGQADLGHGSFNGLPSPGAAAVLASLIMLHEHAAPSFAKILLLALPVVALVCGFLMISRVRYDRITQVYLVRQRPFEHLIALVVILVIFLSFKAETVAVLCVMYALSGPVRGLIRRIRPGKNGDNDPENADSPRNSTEKIA